MGLPVTAVKDPDTGERRRPPNLRNRVDAARFSGGPDDRALRGGDVIRLDASASHQFSAPPYPLYFRIIRVTDADTNDDMMWLDGYELDTAGEAVERRQVLVWRTVRPMPAGWPLLRNAGFHDRRG